MRTYSIYDLKSRLATLNYKWLPFQLIGVRSRNYVKNSFCDDFYLVSGVTVYKFPGTTRPGSYYLLNLLSSKGTAILKPGQYLDKWVLGLHRGKYQAWVQRGPVTVFRDSDKDDLPEEGGAQETGLFGINVHRSNEFTISKLVDKYSAGCQVFANPKDFAIFVELSRNSGQKTFSYTLLEEF